MPEPRSLAEVVEASTRSAQDRMHTAIPAKVLAWYPKSQTVDVQPVNKQVLFNSAGEKSYDDYAAIPNVKVQFPRANGWFFSVPIAVGDYVWLIFNETNIGEWRVTGGTANEPADTRRASMSSPFAIPGAWPDTTPLTNEMGEMAARDAGAVFGREGHEEQVRMSTGSIQIGASASDFVALASLVQTALDSIKTIYNAHTHAVAALGTSAVPIAQLAVLGPVAAAVVKAK